MIPAGNGARCSHHSGLSSSVFWPVRTFSQQTRLLLSRQGWMLQCILLFILKGGLSRLKLPHIGLSSHTNLAMALERWSTDQKLLQIAVG